MKWIRHFLINYGYFSFLVVIFSLFVYAAFFTHPCYDDFSLSANSANRPVLEYWREMYLSWSGRYFFLLLLPFNPIVFDSFIGCQYLLAFLIAILPVAIYFFIDALFRHQLSTRDKGMIALMIAILFYYLMPALPEALYWYTGLVNYQLPVIFSMLFLGLFTHYVNGTYVFSQKINLLLLVIAQFAIIGSSEINLVYIDLFLFFMAVYFFYVKRTVPSFLKILLFFAILFSAFSLLSPGNGARATNFPLKYQLWHSIFNSTLQVARFSIAWITSPLLFIGTLIFIHLNKERSFVFSEKIKIHPIFTSIVLFVIIFFSAFLPYWATGIQGQHRTVNVACQFFILAWFVNLGAFINHYPNLLEKLQNKLNQVKFLFPFLLLLALLLSGNSYLLISDYVSGRIDKHHNLLTERENTLRNAPENIQKIYLPILGEEEIARSIFMYEIREDACNPINQSYALYFHLEPCSVNIKKVKQ